MKFALWLAGRIDALSERVANVVRWGLLLNALLIAGNAVARKLFSVGWAVLYDLQWHFFAAVVLLMAADVLRRDEHVRVDVLAHRLGERGVAWMNLVGLCLILVPLCLLVVWITAPPAIASALAHETRASRDNLTDLPAWIIKGFIPVGFLLLAAQGVAEAIRCTAFLAGRIASPARPSRIAEGAGHVD